MAAAYYAHATCLKSNNNNNRKKDSNKIDLNGPTLIKIEIISVFSLPIAEFILETGNSSDRKTRPIFLAKTTRKLD